MDGDQPTREAEASGMTDLNEGRCLLFRVDAGPRIGSGHLMRCLALGQAWREAGEPVVFVTACESDALQARLREEGFEVRPLPPEVPEGDLSRSDLEDHPDAVVVLDGHHFGEAVQRAVKGRGHGLLVLDDMAHLRRYWADVVVNQNAHAFQLEYSSSPTTKLLLGTAYVLLRREFRAISHNGKSQPEAARHFLVTMGGTDPENLTLRAVKATQRLDLPDLEVVVVVGPQSPHRPELEDAVAETGGEIELVEDVRSMAELMSWADLALCSGGTTVWELAYMGVPTLVIPMSPIEEFLAGGLRKARLFDVLDNPGALTAARLAKRIRSRMEDRGWRERMADRGRELVDGRGVHRVMRELPHGMGGPA